MMDTLLTEIKEIVDKEYHRANRKHPAFASDHEGHDVFCEEVTEALEEMIRIKRTIGPMGEAIRKHDDEAVKKISAVAQRAACHLAAEAVQVAAMAAKIRTSQQLREKKNWHPPYLD